MNIFKYVIIGLLVFFVGIPAAGILFISGINVGTAGLISYVASSVENAENKQAKPEDKYKDLLADNPQLRKIRNTKFLKRMRPQFKHILAWDEFHTERFVKTRIYLSLKQARKLFPKLSQDANPEIAGDFIGQKLAHDECELLQEYFARDCSISRVDVKVIETTSMRKLGVKPYYDVVMNLSFIPSNPFGNFSPTATTLSVHESEIDLRPGLKGNKRELRSSSLEAQKTARRKIYSEVKKSCESIQRASGNCSLSNVYAGTKRVGSSHSKREKYIVSANMNYAYID